MRGKDEQQLDVFSYISPEQRVPHDHPLRPLRVMTDEALRELQPRFNKLYAKTGRPSIAPEKLLRGLLLQALYSVRSERMLMEQLNYNLLFRWFVGLNMDDSVWDVTVFTDFVRSEPVAGHDVHSGHSEVSGRRKESRNSDQLYVPKWNSPEARAATAVKNAATTVTAKVRSHRSTNIGTSHIFPDVVYVRSELRIPHLAHSETSDNKACRVRVNRMVGRPW
jgi:transposase